MLRQAQLVTRRVTCAWWQRRRRAGARSAATGGRRADGRRRRAPNEARGRHGEARGRPFAPSSLLLLRRLPLPLLWRQRLRRHRLVLVALAEQPRGDGVNGRTAATTNAPRTAELACVGNAATSCTAAGTRAGNGGLGRTRERLLHGGRSHTGRAAAAAVAVAVAVAAADRASPGMAAAVNARFGVLYDGVLHTRASSWLVFVTWPTQCVWRPTRGGCAKRLARSLTNGGRCAARV